MSTLKKGIFFPASQLKTENANKQTLPSNPNKTQDFSDSLMQNPNCTCHIGACGCQEKQKRRD
jgi:hypothetical protein